MKKIKKYIFHKIVKYIFKYGDANLLKTWLMDSLPFSYPKIGNNVTIYANSCIIGGISIGDNSVVAAGSVVFNDVPANSLIAGNPAKIIKTLANAQGGA